MTRMTTNTMAANLFLLVSALTMLGCESSGPEFATGETRIVEGILEADETSDSDFFVLTSEGTVNILASSIGARDPETGDPLEEPFLAVAIGQPNPEDETFCQLTFTQGLAEGDSFSVYFRDGLFCISVFRPNATLENAIYEYVITMSGAFS